MTILEALRRVTDAIKTWAEGKFLNKNQGVDNANKIMTVDTDGTVVPKSNVIYVGAEQPDDDNVKVWINTSEDETDSGAIAILPRVATVTLASSAWSGSGDAWTQSIVVEGVTTNTKADLQPTAEQISELNDACIMLMIENNNGSLVCHALGNKPSVDYTMQVLLQEVTII